MHARRRTAPAFEILRALGSGGDADVFEALLHVDGEERRVALRRSRDVMDDDLARDAFVAESRALQALRHPNVVAVHDVIDDGFGGLFQVLELVDGIDLKTAAGLGRSRGQPMPIVAALYVVAKIARGLHYAHEAVDDDGQPLGLIHRDVTPHNVLLAWDGAIKLTDFGAALHVARHNQTPTGCVRGKLAYMAPEQMLGRWLDRRADVFALGCLLWELFEGHTPIAEAEARRALVHGVSVDVPNRYPECVEQLLHQATRRQRDDRFETAADIEAQCNTAIAALGAQRPQLIYRAWLDGVRATSTTRGPFEISISAFVSDAIEAPATDAVSLVEALELPTEPIGTPLVRPVELVPLDPRMLPQTLRDVAPALPPRDRISPPASVRTHVAPERADTEPPMEPTRIVDTLPRQASTIATKTLMWSYAGLAFVAAAVGLLAVFV